MESLVKKSPFERHREEQEAKRKRNEEETAAAYADFIQDFKESSNTSISNILQESDSTEIVGNSHQRRGYPGNIPVSVNSHKKKSNLESFKEELKQKQEGRSQFHDSSPKTRSISPPYRPKSFSSSAHYSEPRYSDGSSRYHDDGLTTNIYLSGLSPSITEDILCEEFGYFGPLASLKILHPRYEEDYGRQNKSGFVAFMKRKDAELAMKKLDSTSVLGHSIKLSWSRSISIPSRPIFESDVTYSLSDERLPFQAELSKGVKFSKVAPPKRSSGRNRQCNEDVFNSTIAVKIPADDALLFRIHLIIEYVLQYGMEFESYMIYKESSNPDFHFLVDNFSPEHVYYRWKMYSLLQGDSIDCWSSQEFRMFDRGSLWIPPENSVKTDGSEILSSLQRKFLLKILSKLTMDRSSIGNAMLYCISHADSCADIVCCLADSICEPNISLPQTVARLFLISDIINNSPAPVRNASKYRTSFEGHLVKIFVHLNGVLMSITSRIKTEQFKKYVLGLLASWGDICLYDVALIDELRSKFLLNTKVTTKKNFKDVIAENSASPGEAPNEIKKDSKFKPISNFQKSLSMSDSVKNTEVEEPREEKSMQDVEEDIDGVPIEENTEEDIDGVPIEEDTEEDIDGAPMSPS